jgi:hypothetical protein
VALHLDGAVGAQVEIERDSPRGGRVRGGPGGVAGSGISPGSISAGRGALVAGAVARRVVGVGRTRRKSDQVGEATGLGEQPESAGTPLVAGLTGGPEPGGLAEASLDQPKLVRDAVEALVEHPGGGGVEGAADLGVVVVGVVDEHVAPLPDLAGAVPAQLGSVGREEPVDDAD